MECGAPLLRKFPFSSSSLVHTSVEMSLIAQRSVRVEGSWVGSREETGKTGDSNSDPDSALQVLGCNAAGPTRLRAVRL